MKHQQQNPATQLSGHLSLQETMRKIERQQESNQS